MRWADAFPNFLIGLREGLEAGLVVSILLAAVRKTATVAAGPGRGSTAPVWLGTVGALSVAGSFAAVLSFSTGVLSSRWQQAAGGLLSVLAVGLVTGMIFWMRRTAATLSAHLRGEVARALTLGAGALALTAFLAVGREGLETTLFLWTAIKASGTTVAPLVGAGVGLATAVVLCRLLFRQAVRLNLGVFFGRTALALIVIAAGVLAYGLGDLQDAALLPGRGWVAFDVTGHADPNSWWVSIISGVTELTPRMSVLQVVAWGVYLAVVIPAFLAAGRAPVVAAAADPGEPSPPGRWARLAGQRPWAVAGVLVALPAVAAGATVAALPSAGAATATAVSVTGTSCAPGWNTARSGTQTFAVTNKSSKAGEVNLVDASGAIVGEIEALGPATTAALTATLGGGSYTFRCYLSGRAATSSATVQVGTTGTQTPPRAVVPVTVAELAGPNRAYQAYAAAVLTTLAHDVAAIRADLGRGDLGTARAGWLAAQLDWERVGASYDSFGAAGVAVDGLPDGLPGGVHDPSFTGLHRLEYGLYHRQTAAQLIPVVDRLARDVATVRHTLTSGQLAGDPTNLPVRAHEILEDALRDHLAGLDDQGAGAAYAETFADTQVTRVVLTELEPLISTRAPDLPRTAGAQLATLQSALLATRNGGRWRPMHATPLAARQEVDAALGALLETLAAVPDLLEVPPTR